MLMANNYSQIGVQQTGRFSAFATTIHRKHISVKAPGGAIPSHDLLVRAIVGQLTVLWWRLQARGSSPHDVGNALRYTMIMLDLYDYYTY